MPFAVIALGRFGGAELSYASDLDVLFVYEGSTAPTSTRRPGSPGACAASSAGRRRPSGSGSVDADLRPEGKQGPLARSVEGYAAYFDRWAHVWERQAMLRARPVAGDPSVAATVHGLLEEFVWQRGLSDDDVREIRRIKARIERERIPAGEDPQFHLKLGRGRSPTSSGPRSCCSCGHGDPRRHRRAPSTRWSDTACSTASDADVLAEAYRFCERTRNRLFLVASGRREHAAAPGADAAAWLARTLDTTPAGLRDDYRRVTRRARQVVERLFYGQQ